MTSSQIGGDELYRRGEESVIGSSVGVKESLLKGPPGGGELLVSQMVSKFRVVCVIHCRTPDIK